jgi:peptidoglycan/LPS O-acetylase OafA/YrhL
VNRAERFSYGLDERQRQAYRPDIDGLRAVSVLAVVAFHMFPSLVPGGFVGVDVFFVISGFLISGIIFDELRRDEFTLKKFYARRVRRIFPALIVVLAASAFAGWWLFLPDDMARLGKQMLSSAVFVSNFYFWFQAGYFSPDAHKLPLLHLWSLGVEEQFYIAWPLALLLLSKKPIWAFRAILVFASLSFMLNLALTTQHDADFYSPATRAWELMLGAGVAWCVRNRRELSLPFPELARSLGLLAILSAVMIFNGQSAYPGWLALLPTLGASVLLLSPGNGLTARLLSSKSMVYVGRISYPLYLWHWPVLVFSEAFKFAPLTDLERGLVIVASFLLASLTYEFVEKPIRSSRSAGVVGPLCAGMMTAAFAGAVIIGTGGFESRFPPEILAIAKGQGVPSEWRLHECFLELPKDTGFAQGCMEDRRPLLLLWGDSTASALMPGLRDRQREQQFGLAEYTTSSCPPRLDVDVPGKPGCRHINRTVLAIIAQARPDVVLLENRGDLSSEDELPGLRNTILALRELSVPRIVVLGPPPVWKRSLPGEAVSFFINHHTIMPERSSSWVYQKWDDTIMRPFVTNLGAVYLSTWQALCDSQGCLTRLSNAPGDLVVWDTHHLTARGSIFLLDKIWRDIWPADFRRSGAPDTSTSSR